jgi:hypothetical protein
VKEKYEDLYQIEGGKEDDMMIPRWRGPDKV